MDWKKLTIKVTLAIVAAILIILVYDATAIMNAGTEASISSLIITKSYEYPLIPFAIGLFFGLLSGHLWWRMKSNEDTKKLNL